MLTPGFRLVGGAGSRNQVIQRVRRRGEPERKRSRSIPDDSDRETIPSLESNRLQGGGRDPVVASELVDQCPGTVHPRVIAVGVGDGAVSDDVVADDDRPGLLTLRAASR